MNVLLAVYTCGYVNLFQWHLYAFFGKKYLHAARIRRTFVVIEFQELLPS
jgi:hypothetical protein